LSAQCEALSELVSIVSVVRAFAGAAARLMSFLSEDDKLLGTAAAAAAQRGTTTMVVVPRPCSSRAR